MNIIQAGIQLFLHRLTAFRSNDKFSIEFKRNILNGHCEKQAEIQHYRNTLLNNHNLLAGEDFGAGSNSSKRLQTVSAYSKRTAISPKKGCMLYHLSRYYKPQTIIEFGTAFGISTLYLAQGNPHARVYTIEGNAGIYGIASAKFNAGTNKNIIALQGRFDDFLEVMKEKQHGLTLIFFDGNHTYEATIRYFKFFYEPVKPAIYVFDDINWSDGMIRAWNEIKTMCNNCVIIDLFQTGIVMKLPGQKNGNYRM